MGPAKKSFSNNHQGNKGSSAIRKIRLRWCSWLYIVRDTYIDKPCWRCVSLLCFFYVFEASFSLFTDVEFLLEEAMLVRKAQSKKKSASGAASAVPLDSSLTSIEWLPNMQIGENSTTPPVQQTLPVTSHIPQKIEATKVEMPTTTVHENLHAKPPYSYVTLIRQAILSTRLQCMTLNEIYKWIIDSYPYFRSAPPKWKVRESPSESGRTSNDRFLELHSSQSVIE